MLYYFLLPTAIAALLQYPSSAQTTHLVGDALGWVIPPTNNTYSTWAASNTFLLGDSLVFNFTNRVHDVAEMTKADFDACNTSNPIVLITSSPASIALNKTGQHYFICTFFGHCNAGQKLTLNVLATAPSPAPEPPAPSPAPEPPAPSSAPEPPAPEPPAPSLAPEPEASTDSPVPEPSPGQTRSPMTFTVGDGLGWVVPPNASFYQEWSRGKSFMVGDILVFNYVNGRHNVAEVTKQARESCNANSPLSLSTNPPTRITLTTAGDHFYICAFTGHCSAGQMLAINVSRSSDAAPLPPPSPATPSPPVSNLPSSPSPDGSSASPPTPGMPTLRHLCAFPASSPPSCLLSWHYSCARQL